MKLFVLLLLGMLVCRAGAAENDAAQLVTLENSVRLVLKAEPTSETVAATVLIRMPADTTPQEAATGELVAHALFFGSLNRTFEAVADSAAQVGGDLEILRTPDYVAFTCVTVPRQLREALYLLCEALKNADFNPEALDRARHNLEEEQQKRALRPFDVACDACRTQFGNGSERSPALLRRVTPEKALAYFQSRYVPSRTVVAVVGKFKLKTVQELLDSFLVDYDRQPPRYPPFPPEPRPISGSEQTLTLPTFGTTAYALVGASAPGVASPDYPAFTVLQALFGGGHAARLFRRVRDTLGLGYEVGASYQADRADPLIAYLQWDTKRANARTPEEALALLRAQLDALLSDPPTEAEVARARNVAIGRDALRHERVRERAFLLGWYETMGLKYTFDRDFPQHLATVTRDDLLRVARTYLSHHAAVLATPN